MAQLIQCPECDKQLQVPEDLLGKHVQCPGCKHTFIAALPEPVSHPGPAKVEPLREEAPPKPAKRDVENRYDAEDDRPIRRPAGSDRKPSKVQTIGILTLVGGIFAILLAVGMAAGSTGVCCMWPGTYYSFVLGVMAIVRGSAILGNKAYLEKPPTGLAIMHIVNIINLDITNLVIGIVLLNFCNDEEVKEYMAK